METELFSAVTAGDLEKAKELLKKETKETIDQVRWAGSRSSSRRRPRRLLIR